MKQTYLSLVSIISCYHYLSIILEDLCDDPSNRLTLRELFRQIVCLNHAWFFKFSNPSSQHGKISFAV